MSTAGLGPVSRKGILARLVLGRRRERGFREGLHHSQKGEEWLPNPGCLCNVVYAEPVISFWASTAWSEPCRVSTPPAPGRNRGHWACSELPWWTLPTYSHLTAVERGATAVSPLREDPWSFSLVFSGFCPVYPPPVLTWLWILSL